jgi:hypothetical protein
MTYKTYLYFTAVAVLAVACFVVFQPHQETTEDILAKMEPKPSKDKVEIIYTLDGMLEYSERVTQDK